MIVGGRCKRKGEADFKIGGKKVFRTLYNRFQFFQKLIQGKQVHYYLQMLLQQQQQSYFLITSS